jgi:hypothetical protein
MLEYWTRCDLFLGLLEDLCPCPRRIAHELLQCLAIATRQPPFDKRQ